MKVLLINGSPHEKGCTYTALSLIAGELNAAGIETEILNVGTKPVGVFQGVPGMIIRYHFIMPCLPISAGTPKSTVSTNSLK